MDRRPWLQYECSQHDVLVFGRLEIAPELFGRKPRLSPEQIKHARDLRAQGKHPDDIGALLKCSRATVYRALT
jgi:hypothetical protein